MRPLDPRLLRHARSARPFILGCAALGVLTAGLVLAQADLLAATISRAFLDDAGITALTIPIGLLALIILARAAVSWWVETAAHQASASVLGELRAAVVRHVLRTGPRRAAGRSPTELAALAIHGVDRLDGYFARYLPQLLIASVVPALVAGRILLADWVAALIVGSTVPLIPLFMILIGRFTQRRVQRQRRTLSKLGNHFLDLVAGLTVLSAFGRARAQRRTLAEITNRYRVQTMHTLRIAFLSALVLELLATLSVALIAVSIGLRLVAGSFDLHTALVILILAPEVYLPLRAVGARFHDSAEGVAAAEEIFALLEEPAPTGSRAPAPNPALVPLRLRGITMHGRSGPVFENLTLAIQPGEIVGITGPSGAGKSTILDLLLGWYPPDDGQICVDGVDLADLDRDAWQTRIAWVPQQPRLIAGTVADNIRLGSPTATDDEVRTAALAAALDIPLDTVVGELGAGLSTGQQRRVALARAALLDRPLVLLDEPTEGVDADTEAAILHRLPTLLTGRTAIIVTHRESLLDLCDWVIQLPAPTYPQARTYPQTRSTSPAPSPPLDTMEPGPPPGEGGGHPGVARDVDHRRQHPGVGVADHGEAAWRWLRAAVRPHRIRLVLAILAGAAALASGVALTTTSAWLISTAALHPPVLTLMVAIVAVRTFGLAKGILRYIERLLSHDVALRALADLRVRVWTALVRLGPAVTGRIRRGDLLNRLVTDVDSQQDVLVRGLVPAVSATIVAAGTAIGIGVLLPEAGLTVALGLVTAGLFAPAVSLLAARSAERRTAMLRSDVVAGAVETLTAAPDLIAFGAAARRQNTVGWADAALTRALRSAAIARGAGIALATLAIGATTLACLILGILALRDGRLPGPELAALALTPLACAELVAGLPDAATRLLSAKHCARRLAELDATPTPIVEPVAPQPVPTADQLAVDHLAVRWPGAADPAITELSLHTDTHRSTVLTGPSGAGKSTAIAAIMRHLDPSAGRILLNHTDTRTLDSDAARTQIAWCGPDTHLFDSTLRENLRLARPAASDTEIVAALELAQLGPWLTGLPDGLDTALGAHGTPVSGGECQRIGVARALLADRPIMLFDEPTAHLDGPTAARLAADLNTLTTGRATLIVTHRPTEFPDLPAVSVGPRPAIHSDAAHALPRRTR